MSVILRLAAHMGWGGSCTFLLISSMGRAEASGITLGRGGSLEAKMWAEFLPCPRLPTKPSHHLPGVTQAGLPF